MSMRIASPFLVLSSMLLLCLPAAAAAVTIVLPDDWSEGASARYRVEWKRRSDPGPVVAVSSADDALVGEVDVQVAAASTASLRMHWRPDIGEAWRPQMDGSADTAAAGTLLWRHPHALAQRLTLVPQPQGAALHVDNADTLQAQMRDEIHRVLAELDMDLRCTAGSTDVLCARVASPEAAAQWAIQASAPFFNCVGLEVDSGQPRNWSVPFDIQGMAGNREFTAEVLEFDANATELRIRLTETRDTSALARTIDDYEDRMDPAAFAELRRSLLDIRYRHETECRMQRSSGWPIEVRHSIHVTSPMGGGSEHAHYLRIDRAADSPP
jgi:hypothetical protein